MHNERISFPATAFWIVAIKIGRCWPFKEGLFKLLRGRFYSTFSRSDGKTPKGLTDRAVAKFTAMKGILFDLVY